MEIQQNETYLRQRSSEIDIKDALSIIEALKETLKTCNGLGLAGVQISKLFRVFIVKLNDGEIRAFVNPTITKLEDKVYINESCLSFPNKIGRASCRERV